MTKKIAITLGLIILTSILVANICDAEETEMTGYDAWINVKITNTETNRDILKVRVPVAFLGFLEDQCSGKIDMEVCDSDDIKIGDLVEFMKKYKNKYLVKIHDFKDKKRILVWID